MKKTNNYKKYRPQILIIGVALIGFLVLATSRAATNYVAIEAENLNISSPAKAINDSSASGDKAILFGLSSTNTGDGCEINGTPAPCIGNNNQGASGWGNTVFSDEFSGTTLDTSKWAPCWFPGAFPGSDVCGEMNDSKTLKSNVRVENGNVILRQSTVIENSTNDYGALIMTLPSEVDGPGFTMTDGYFAEARVYFPGNGSRCYNWPAWWINGGQSGYGDGEIDVAEILGSGYMHSNYHFDRGNGHETDNNEINGYWCGEYHVYGVDRQNGQNIVYFDGAEVVRYPTYDNGAPQYLVFNVGYKTGKTPKAGSESDVKVDYVRVWKK